MRRRLWVEGKARINGSARAREVDLVFFSLARGASREPCAQRYSCRVVGDKSLIQIINKALQAEACLLLVTAHSHITHSAHSSQFFFFAADAFALTTMSGLAPNGATPVSAVKSGVKTMNATHAKRA